MTADAATAITYPSVLPYRLFLKLAFLAALGSLGWLVAPPEGLAMETWHLLSIFVATVAGLVMAPLPNGALAFFALSALTVTGTLSTPQVLEGFSHSVVWLIILALMIARGFVKTGLGQRIALHFLAFFGKRSLGLGYGLLLTDLILAPAIPSNTARCGGLLLPITRGLLTSLGERSSARSLHHLGAFLTLVVFHGSVVSSAMFVTAMAANPLIIQLASDAGVHIDWLTWAKAAVLPGIMSMGIIPVIIRGVTKPDADLGKEAVQLAKRELNSLGKMTAQEWCMLATFILLVGLWVFGSQLHIEPTTAAIIGLSLLLLTQVLTWKDILRETVAWDTMFWFAILIVMATHLNRMGLMTWMSHAAGVHLVGWSWPAVVCGISLFYYYSHYLFASNTAHITSMFAPLLAICLGAGAPGLLATLILAFISNLFGGLTHYGSGHAPVLFGAGYVTLKTWWKVGLILSVVHLLIWGVVGAVWWHIIGLW